VACTLRTQFAYRNAVVNSICLSKRGCELNLLIETRLRTQFAYRNAIPNSICLSKRGCELNLPIETRLRSQFVYPNNGGELYLQVELS
jgi:hypothetical protein